MRIGVAFAVSIALGAWISGQSQREPLAVFTETPPTWFEDFSKVADLSPDGRWAIYGAPGARRLIDLQTGNDAAERFARGFDRVRDGVFLPDGTLARRGTRGGQEGWFIGEDAGVRQVRIPADPATPRWSRKGRVAFTRAAAPTIISIGEEDARTDHEFSKRIVGFAWMPDGETILVLAREPHGGSTLHTLDVASNMRRVVASDLDTSAWFPGPAPMPDGRSAVIALASTGPPDAEARHRPDSDRDQDLYSIDLKTGELGRIADSPADDFAPAIVGGRLHWTRNHVEHSVVLVPSGGDGSRVIFQGGQLPSWHPSGRQLAYMIGDWRMVDIPMNLDAFVVDIDGHGTVQSPPRPVVTGYHEDFPPVWSSDGRWMAYHSHRSPTPIAFHNAPGATDDIYIRRADDPDAKEIRLTDFGWEVGTPSWSPDGRRLLLTSFEKGAPGVSVPWLLTFDPEKGRAERVEKWRVPEQIKGVKGLAWSPTGEWVAIDAEAPDAGARELWLVSPDGVKSRRLTAFRSTTHGGLDWSPDGRSVVYSALVDGRMQFFSIALNAEKPRQLTHDQGNLLHPRVSPDGRWIAGTRLRVTKSIMRLE
jgi:Tol biopolymer transport system component